MYYINIDNCIAFIQIGPQVAILPLGTGNDLSRVLGWGEGHDSNVNVYKIMKQLQHAKPVKLDRSVTPRYIL